jgi:hypothetical protein
MVFSGNATLAVITAKVAMIAKGRRTFFAPNYGDLLFWGMGCLRQRVPFSGVRHGADKRACVFGSSKA